MDGTPDSMDMSSSKLLEMVKDREAWKTEIHEDTESDTTEELNNNKPCSAQDARGTQRPSIHCLISRGLISSGQRRARTAEGSQRRRAEGEY